jgi:hypothetical protein
MDKMRDRIEREAELPGLVSLLAERLTATDLQSLLLEVYRLRAKQRGPTEVLADYERNRFVRPSSASARRLLEWETIACSQLPPSFELLALSPVSPLGTCSAVAAISQDWAVSTARNTEVVSDSTNVLALECALRRRALLRQDPRSSEPVHLASSHRLLRAQRYEDPGLLPHFSLFALCSAGKDQGNLGFELSALTLHAGFYLRALRAFLGQAVGLRLSATDFAPSPRYALVESHFLSPVREEFPDVPSTIDEERQSGRGYYGDLCFHIDALAPSGRPIQLVDGGSVDWTQKLLSNAKERLVTSGVGSERVCSSFPA